MYASTIIARARSLADLPNSTAITYEDEINSLNEKYHDIINELYKANDDYYYKEVVYSNWQQYQDPNNSYNYLIPLPEDFYKLRAVDYQETTYWRPIKKAPFNLRDQVNNEVMYRLQNNNLWIICGSTSWLPASIKLGYYPVPQVLTTPQDSTMYYPDIDVATEAVNTAAFIPALYKGLNPLYYDQMLYNVGNALYVDVPSLKLSKVHVADMPLAGMSCLQYYRGYLYTIDSGDIYRTAYSPADTPSLMAGTSPTLLTWTNLTATTPYTGLIDYMSIKTYTNSLGAVGTAYFSTTDNLTYSASLTFVGATQIYAAKYDAVVDLDCGYRVLLGAAGLVVDTTPTVTPTIISLGITAVTNLISANGTTTAYYRDSTAHLHSFTLDITTGIPSILEDNIVADEIFAIQNSMIPTGLIAVVDNSGYLYTISALVDTDLTYPSNVLYECLAYQMAVDFKRKYDMMNPELDTRKNEIWNNFLHSIIRRDEYNPERIQNKRPILNANGYGFNNY